MSHATFSRAVALLLVAWAIRLGVVLGGPLHGLEHVQPGLAHSEPAQCGWCIDLALTATGDLTTALAPVTVVDRILGIVPPTVSPVAPDLAIERRGGRDPPDGRPT